MRKIITILTLFLIVFGVTAQETCQEKLILANNNYENGQFDKAIELASTCVESESPRDQWGASKLLALVYLAQGNRLEAKKYAEKMLELNANYVSSKAKDPEELRTLLKSVKVIPKYVLAFAGTFGVGTTFPTVQNTYNGSTYSKEYSGLGSWQVGIIPGYNMNRLISLHSGLMVTSKKFELTYNIEGNDISYKETDRYLNLPLFARFQTSHFKKVRYFVDLGIYSGRLLSSSVDIKRYFQDSKETTEYNKLNAMNRRNKWEYGSIFGAGVAFKRPMFDITVDAKYYAASFYNMTNEDTRYTEDNLFYKAYYLDDDIRTSNFSLSVSFLYNVNYRVLKDK